MSWRSFLSGVLALELLALLGARPASAAIALRDTTEGNVTAYSPITVTLPAATATGDFVLVIMTGDNGVAFTMPSGWTLLTASTVNVGSSKTAAAYYHFQASGDPLSISVAYSPDSGHQISWAGIAYSGVDTTNPLDGTPVGVSGSTSQGTTLTLPSISPANANGKLVALFSAYTGGHARTYTYSPTLTQEIIEPNPPGSDYGEVVIADSSLSSAGATGSETITSTSSVFWAGYMVVLKAASATPRSPQNGWVVVP